MPVAIFGIIYLVLVAPWLLPVRVPASAEFASRVREYTIAMMVQPKSSIAGKTIEASDLRHLKGLYLFEVQRDGYVIEAPGSTFVLQENDQLYFTGDLNAVRELWLHDVCLLNPLSRVLINNDFFTDPKFSGSEAGK